MGRGEGCSGPLTWFFTPEVTLLAELPMFHVSISVFLIDIGVRYSNLPRCCSDFRLSYFIPTNEEDILTYDILILTNREIVKSESVTSNRYRIEVTP